MTSKHEKGRPELSATAEDFVPAATPAPSVATPATPATPATNAASPVPPGFAEPTEDEEHPKSPELNKRRCWDWVVVRGNCHYARDRRSFSWYRPLRHRTLVSFCDEEPPVTPVAGIGTVTLNVRSRPEEGRSTSQIKLRDVIHVPHAPCNGFSPSKFHRRSGGTLLTGEVVAADKQNIPWYYCVPFHGRKKLALAGNPEGKSYIAGDAATYCLDMVLNDREMAEIKYRPPQTATEPRSSAPDMSLPIYNQSSNTGTDLDGSPQIEI